MSREKASRIGRIRNAVISVLIGGIIVWFLLSKIDPRNIPHAIGNIPLHSLLFALMLHVVATFLKAVRFKIILRTGVSLGHLFPIVSVYMFFTGILPMRTGELSYVYLLKQQTRTPGAKSLASLVVGAIADIVVIVLGILILGHYLRAELGEGTSYFLSALMNGAGALAQRARDNFLMLIIVVTCLAAVAAMLILLRNRGAGRRQRTWQYIKSKILEVGHELADTSLDLRLIGIFLCSILIIVFRFGTQCYLVRAMGIDIGLWKLNFALFFGAFFAMLPIHGPASIGTAEAPWVAILYILGVSEQDAITSGFSLHIIVIIYSIIMGLYGALSLKVSRYV